MDIAAVAPLTDDELQAWLRLLACKGIGRTSARRLLASLGSPQAVFDANASAWRSVVGPVQAAALAVLPEGLAQRVAATRTWLQAAEHRRVMVLGDVDYPAQLLNTADPPLLLYLWGRAELLARPSVAVVGSRSPTPQGRDNARQFAVGLVRSGWTVVSGLARGIDGAAHEGALEAAAQRPPDQASGASTIAVVGTGIDIVYPLAHRALCQRIVTGGLLVSEWPLGTPPLPENFPQRNRIIAGLAQGTLVVEAALRSGSLITARLAAEAGREVMVIPGSILSAQAQGGHALIRQGAALVGSVEQVLQELSMPASAGAGGSALPQEPASPAEGEIDSSQHEDPVLRAMGTDPCSLDALMARCGWSAADLNVQLLALELLGQVARLPGGLYQRTGHG